MLVMHPGNKVGAGGGGGDNSKAIAKKTNNVFTFNQRLEILTGRDTSTVVSPNTVKGWDIYEVRASVNLGYGGNVQLVKCHLIFRSQLWSINFIPISRQIVPLAKYLCLDTNWQEETQEYNRWRTCGEATAVTSM